MKYVFAKDLARIQGIKGQIIESKNGITLVKTLDIYTVWNAEDGFIFTHTFSIKEAAETFEKYSNGRV